MSPDGTCQSKERVDYSAGSNLCLCRYIILCLIFYRPILLVLCFVYCFLVCGDSDLVSNIDVHFSSVRRQRLGFFSSARPTL